MVNTTAGITVWGILARDPFPGVNDAGNPVTHVRLARVNTRALGYGVDITDATGLVDIEVDGRLPMMDHGLVDVGDRIEVSGATPMRPRPGAGARRLAATASQVTYRPVWGE